MEEELIGRDVMTLMEGMSAHHAERLGFEPKSFVNVNRSFVREMFQKQM